MAENEAAAVTADETAESVAWAGATSSAAFYTEGVRVVVVFRVECKIKTMPQRAGV